MHSDDGSHAGARMSLLSYFHHFSNTHTEQMVKGLLASDCHTGPLLPILSFKDQVLTFVLTLDSAIVCGRAQAGNEQKIKAIYVTKPTCHVTLKKVVSMSITKKRVLENVNLVVYLPLSHAPDKKSCHKESSSLPQK